MKVSIIVPVYKVPEKYLRNCINSLKEQTIDDYEVILVDDGSPDNCGQICDIYAEKYSFIRSIHQNNQGVSVARNRGIVEACGKYVVFVDADDVLKPHACEYAYSILEDSDNDILFFRHSSSIEEQGNMSVNDCSKMAREIQLKIINKLYNCPIKEISFGSPWAKMFRRDFLINNKLQFKKGLRKAQDRLFMLNCIEKNAIMAIFDYDGYCYNTNPESICWNYNKKIDEIGFDMINSFNEFVEQNHYADIDYQKAMEYFKLNVLFEILHLKYFHKNNKDKWNKRYNRALEIVSNEIFSNAFICVNTKAFGRNRKIILDLFKRKCYYLAFIILDLSKLIRE